MSRGGGAPRATRRARAARRAGAEGAEAGAGGRPCCLWLRLPLDLGVKVLLDAVQGSGARGKDCHAPLSKPILVS